MKEARERRVEVLLFSKGKKVCKESENLNLEREIQVRGVVFHVFNSCIMSCNDMNRIV